jgi:hypothetical protein
MLGRRSAIRPRSGRRRWHSDTLGDTEGAGLGGKNVTEYTDCEAQATGVQAEHCLKGVRSQDISIGAKTRIKWLTGGDRHVA